VYVDDILFFARDDSRIENTIELLKTKGMAIRRQGTAEGFLGVDIERSVNTSGRRQIKMAQKGLTQRVIIALGLDSNLSTSISTPAEASPLPKFNNECIQQINLFYGLDLDASDFIGAMTHLLENNLDGAIAWLLFGKCPIPKGRYDAHGTTMSDGVESASESAKQSPSLIVLAPIIQAFDKLGLLHGEANSKDVCTLQANGRNCKDPSVDQGIKPAHVINFVSAAFKAASGGLHFCGMGGKTAMKNVTDKLCSRLFESCYNANHFSLGACMTGGILGDTVAHTREMSLDYKTLFEGPGVLVIVHEALVKDPNVTFIQNVDVTEEEIATLRAAVFKRRSEKSKKLHEKKVKNKHAGVEVSAHGLAMGTALHEKKVKNKHGVEA
jgi:hypothetical protein